MSLNLLVLSLFVSLVLCFLLAHTNRMQYFFYLTEGEKKTIEPCDQTARYLVSFYYGKLVCSYNIEDDMSCIV